MSSDFKKSWLCKITYVGVLSRWREMYPSDVTYDRLARALQHPAVDRVDVAVKYCGLQVGKDAAVAGDY